MTSSNLLHVQFSRVKVRVKMSVFFVITAFLSSYLDYSVTKLISYTCLFLALFSIWRVYIQLGQIAMSKNVLPIISDNKNHDELTQSSESLSSASIEKLYATLSDKFKFAFFVVEGDEDIIKSNQMCSLFFSINQLTRVRQFRNISPDIYNLIKEGKEQSKLCTVQLQNMQHQAIVKLVSLNLEGSQFNVVLVSDIHQFLEQNQHDTQEKILKVIAHEVMNGLGPIISLSQSAQHALTIHQGDADKTVKLALDVIERRAEGLQKFVEGFQGLTQLPEPQLCDTNIQTIVEGVIRNRTSNIHVHQERSARNILVKTDPHLLEQVLINLIKNAEDAIRDIENGEINVMINRPNLRQLTIDVVDNGIGIRPDLVKNLFVPFFTSKQDGTGIGLALSKQICYLLGIHIGVSSKQKHKTIFTLTFQI